MEREQRAKQFLPFSALKGYEEALREKEKVWLPRPLLCEERAEELDAGLRQVERGDLIEVTFYRAGEYRRVRGRVNRLERESRLLEVEEERIRFDDLYDLKIQ